MEIFERYIREVTRHLPRSQREDVARELRSTLEDSLEGRLKDGAGESAAATETLLNFGPPRALAASYRSGPRHLIGPSLYPDFMNALKITLLVVCGLQLTVAQLSHLPSRPHLCNPSRANSNWIRFLAHHH